MDLEYVKLLATQAIAYAPKVVMALIAWVIGLFIIAQLMKLVGKAMDSRKMDPTLKPFLISMLNFLLKILVIVTIAGILGIDTASFAAVIAAVAFAVGMALQGSLGNFAGGVMLLIFKPIKVGDLVNAMGYTGVVEEIQAFATILVTPDNRTIILPNGALSTSPIENITTKGIIRVDMTFGISYSADIDKARSVIKEVSDSCPYLLEGKETDIFISSLGDSSVNFAVRPWTSSATYWDTNFFFHENIKKEFDKKGVDIPFNTIDINMIPPSSN